MTSGTYKSFQLFVPMPSLMDRYITTELLSPFLFGVGAFSSIGVAVGTAFDLVRTVVESGLLLSIAVQVFLLKMPAFVVLAFPMSTLLAVLITYSRLAGDSELIALRSCGISIYRLVMPAIILSFIVTGLTFLFNEQVVPAANYQATVTLERALKKDKPAFQEQNIFYPEYQEVKQPDNSKARILARLFYADGFDGERMQGLVIVDNSQSGIQQIVVSDSAAWNPTQNTWDFFNGTIYVVAADGSYRNVLRFDHQQLQLPQLPLDLAGKNRDSDEMNIAQVKQRLEIARIKGDEKNIRKFNLRIQEKIAFPFACVVFGLVGASLGAKPRRNSNRATSFGISIVVIFSYYLLSFICDALGIAGILVPVMAAWLPSIFGFGVGALLLFRAAQ